MTAGQPVRMSRRRVVASLVGVPIAAAGLASCSLSPARRATSLAEVPDADARRRWTAIRTERDLAALLTATAAAHSDLGGSLTTYADLHGQHVATLREEGPLPRLADPDSDVPAPSVAPAPGDAVAAILAAEQAAVESLVASCEGCQGPRLAAILASIAASDAGIAAVLEAR